MDVAMLKRRTPTGLQDVPRTGATLPSWITADLRADLHATGRTVHEAFTATSVAEAIPRLCQQYETYLRSVGVPTDGDLFPEQWRALAKTLGGLVTYAKHVRLALSALDDLDDLLAGVQTLSPTEAAQTTFMALLPLVVRPDGVLKALDVPRKNRNKRLARATALREHVEDLRDLATERLDADPSLTLGALADDLREQDNENPEGRDRILSHNTYRGYLTGLKPRPQK